MPISAHISNKSRLAAWSKQQKNTRFQVAHHCGYEPFFWASLTFPLEPTNESKAKSCSLFLGDHSYLTAQSNRAQRPTRNPTHISQPQLNWAQADPTNTKAAVVPIFLGCPLRFFCTKDDDSTTKAASRWSSCLLHVKHQIDCRDSCQTTTEGLSLPAPRQHSHPYDILQKNKKRPHHRIKKIQISHPWHPPPPHAVTQVGDGVSAALPPFRLNLLSIFFIRTTAQKEGTASRQSWKAEWQLLWIILSWRERIPLAHAKESITWTCMDRRNKSF